MNISRLACFLSTSFTFSFSPRRPGGDVSGSFPGFPPFPFEEAGNFGASARIRLKRRECLRIQTQFSKQKQYVFLFKDCSCCFYHSKLKCILPPLRTLRSQSPVLRMFSYIECHIQGRNAYLILNPTIANFWQIAISITSFNNFSLIKCQFQAGNAYRFYTY